MNPGTSLDLDWVMSTHVNKPAAQRRAATLGTRRSVKKTWQAAWLLRAVTLIDLTTLSGDDTPGRVRRLCAKARQPIRREVLEALDWGRPLTVAAVCVYPARVTDAVAALRGTDIPVATVSSGFPAAQSALEPQLEVVRKNVAEGAKEIDMVISREYVHTGSWQALYDEVAAFRAACGEGDDRAHLKVILETGELGTLTNVYRASLVAMMAGGDFVKTSTGKASENATLPVGLVMVRAIREYCQRTGHKVGFKPAGGIRSAKQSLVWLSLMKEELGNDWLEPSLFRIGASSLLDDIARQLSHHVTGRYAARHHIPMG
jgi:deoxyribose-phosphate aldolase